ncbi:MAG TPA: helix-turn-helix domain-containing protein [Roseomonas sp.]|nr:helix-turn-helix domain-containing protein [Roseomonas sp.]
MLSSKQRYLLSPQALLVHDHIERTGSISAREAMSDYSITSATLARRVCDLEQAGVRVRRLRREHPITGRKYTRYALGN